MFNPIRKPLELSKSYRIYVQSSPPSWSLTVSLIGVLGLVLVIVARSARIQLLLYCNLPVNYTQNEM